MMTKFVEAVKKNFLGDVAFLMAGAIVGVGLKFLWEGFLVNLFH